MAPPTKHSSDTILDAARAIVLRDGPRAASISAIAKFSGAPVGTLYHRFGNRDGVLAAAWFRALERFQALVMAEIAAHDDQVEHDPVERGVAMVAGAMEFGRHCPEDAQLLLAVRRADLLDTATDADMVAQLNAMNAPLIEELHSIARQLHGKADARGVEMVTRAVVDLPYAAIRRYVGSDGLPEWLVEDLTRTARQLLRG